MDIFNTKNILREKRWKWIDYDKGISIILVGFGHTLSVLQGHVALSSYPFFNYIGTFLYGFRMPLFFIISGIFIASGLKRKGINKYVSNRADTILYPLIIWGGIQITLQLLTARFTNNSITPINYLDLLIDPRQDGHFWYLNALFFIGVIYAILKSVLNLKPLTQVGFGLLLYCFSAYLHLNDLHAGALTDICEFYLFFSIGDLISSGLLAEENVKRFSSLKIFFPLLVVFLIVQYQFAKINLNGGVEGINYVEHKMPFFFLFEALLGCTISINFSFLLQKYNALRFLRVIGFNSLFVYCMQIIVVTIARVVLVNLLKVTYVPAVVMTVWVSGVIIPVVFYNLCMHFNIWWLFTFKRPEKQKAIAPEEPELSLKSA
ncbi:MAG: acyltransferase family protein [Bacteroidota bacterium]|nr:acyltransferase family protein [Bacteroidota bacterium]